MTNPIARASSGLILPADMSSVDFRSIVDPDHAVAALRLLQGMDGLYPGFERWFREKAVPDLANGSGRMVLAVDRKGGVVGLAIGKRTVEERKLRCLVVAPEARSAGIGGELFERMFDELGTRTPTCSVSEEVLNEFRPLVVEKYGFRLTRTATGIYRPGKTEFFFNDGEKL